MVMGVVLSEDHITAKKRGLRYLDLSPSKYEKSLEVSVGADVLMNIHRNALL